jgi:ubiquinone/menaquinone biosynthesis C-methylase UbiE
MSYAVLDLRRVPTSAVMNGILQEYRAVYRETAPNLLRAGDYKRWSYILSVIEETGPMLDVGIGAGQLVNAAWRSGQFKSITGVDITPHSKLLRLHDDINLVWTNAADMPFPDRSFDVVTCLECLEHLDTPTMTAAIAELRRVTRRQLLMTVPFREPEPLPRHHVQRFDEARISRLFPDAQVTLLTRGSGVPWVLLEEWPNT